MSDLKNISLEERFIVLRQIGSGGFSKVYKVEDKEKQNQVFALKIMNFEVSDTEPVHQVEFEEFQKEVDYLKRLNHDSIVRMEEELVVDNRPAILMELVEGKSIQDIIDKEGIATQEEIIEVALHISAGLMACHKLQIPINQAGLDSETILLRKHAIIHNDVSAKNIIKEIRRGRVNYKLIDFGLSYVENERKDKENKLRGTFEYYPPEKWKGEEVTTASDIYSFGVVLYQMLTGTVPFPIDNYGNRAEVESAKEKTINNEIPEIWNLRKQAYLQKKNLKVEVPDYPYWLDLLVKKCLEKDPKNRFRTGDELNKYLQDGKRGKLQEEWKIKEDPKEKEDWIVAYQLYTIESITDFIKKYPEGNYTAQAKLELEYLEETIRNAELENASWGATQRRNTIEAYENFKKEYPNSPKILLANQRIEELRRIEEEKKKENRAWQEVTKSNTLKAYKHFVTEYPNSIYIPTAQKRIEEIKAKKKEEEAKYKKILLFALGGIVALLIGYFAWTKISNTSSSEEVVNISKEEEVIKGYYTAKYIDNDLEKKADEFLLFPLEYNGQQLSKDNFIKLVQSEVAIAKMLRSNGSHITNKKVTIDSLQLMDSIGNFKVYGKYQYLKSKEGKQPIKRDKNIREKITLKENKIQSIEEL